MDIYQIIVTHNRSWTIREIIAFAVVFLIAAFLAAVLLKQHKIVVMQAVCGLLLLTFLAIVFGSTVFTRTPGIRQYQLEVFWSWKEILGIGKCGRLGSTAEGSLLQENLLNILLLFPAGRIGVRPYEIRINKNIEICRKMSAKDECNNR